MCTTSSQQIAFADSLMYINCMIIDMPSSGFCFIRSAAICAFVTCTCIVYTLVNYREYGRNSRMRTSNSGQKGGGGKREMYSNNPGGFLSIGVIIIYAQSSYAHCVHVRTSLVPLYGRINSNYCDDVYGLYMHNNFFFKCFFSCVSSWNQKVSQKINHVHLFLFHLVQRK